MQKEKYRTETKINLLNDDEKVKFLCYMLEQLSHITGDTSLLKFSKSYLKYYKGDNLEMGWTGIYPGNTKMRLGKTNPEDCYCYLLTYLKHGMALKHSQDRDVDRLVFMAHGRLHDVLFWGRMVNAISDAEYDSFFVNCTKFYNSIKG